MKTNKTTTLVFIFDDGTRQKLTPGVGFFINRKNEPSWKSKAYGIMNDLRASKVLFL